MPPTYLSHLSTPPPQPPLSGGRPHTHTHLLGEVCTYVCCGAPIYVRNIPPFEYMILGSFRRSYRGIKWVQVIFVILLHSHPHSPHRSQKSYIQRGIHSLHILARRTTNMYKPHPINVCVCVAFLLIAVVGGEGWRGVKGKQGGK